MNARNDEAFMRRAIQLSKRGFPAPNPHVGCVIVHQGEIVGEGWHAYAGGDHAEVVALKQTRGKAKGATAYVTLEPCNHQGKTPPCTLALIQAGIQRVVVATLDPNPKAKGGIEVLRSRGIETIVGVQEGEARRCNEQFLTAMAQERPYVVVKAALSLDGRIALPSGESKWITSEPSRRQAHRLRAECGAVLVGRKTVEKDDPSLTARIPGVKNQPLRIVLDPHSKLTGNEKIFNEQGEVFVVNSSVVSYRNGAFDWDELMQVLWTKRVMGLLVEGGARTITGFIQQRLANRLELFIAPKLLGDGPSWIGDMNLVTLDQCPRLNIVSSKRCGQDMWITAEPQSA